MLSKEKTVYFIVKKGFDVQIFDDDRLLTLDVKTRRHRDLSVGLMANSKDEFDFKTEKELINHILKEFKLQKGNKNNSSESVMSNRSEQILNKIKAIVVSEDQDIGKTILLKDKR